MKKKDNEKSNTNKYIEKTPEVKKEFTSPHDDPEALVDVKFYRKLPDDARRLAYRCSYGGMFFPLHLGQRKLLISEIEFLTMHGHKSKHIVYAGAAGGQHIIELYKLFPQHYYYLYDESAFDHNLIRLADRINNITIFKQLFLDEDAEKYKDKNVLLISDIRTNNERDFEETVPIDMELQKSWFFTMKPAAAMFKFRLPYIGDSGTNKMVKYFDGDIYVQPWAPSTSTESRLIVTSEKMKIYDSMLYEEQMFRHNACTRVQWFTHNIPLDQVKGLDYCYDCNSEVHILKEYLRKIKKISESDLVPQVIKLINSITITLNRHLDSPPHGLLPYISFRQKRDKLQRYLVKRMNNSKKKFFLRSTNNECGCDHTCGWQG